MKIDISTIDRESFMVHEHTLNGESVYLVQPVPFGTKWTKDNLHFRSSVWNSDGKLVSASFPKFFNWGEQPEVSPVPSSLNNCTVVEKLDGSTLIVSKYKGQYILRTRGTVDATALANGHELELFKFLLPKIEFLIIQLEQRDWWEGFETWPVSVLFEWVSPINKIVIDYGNKPDWYLIGIISHYDYRLGSQELLDGFAEKIGVKRPQTYTFTDINDLLTTVEQWKGKEGTVTYSKNGQVLHKNKSVDYLIRHRFKANATLENTLDLYFSYGKPSYQEFESKLIQSFDYECFEMVRGYASQVCDAAKEANNLVEGFQYFIDSQLKPLSTRREQAQKVLSSYAQSNRSAMVFTLLDGKSLSPDQEKKLYWQVLKK